MLANNIQYVYLQFRLGRSTFQNRIMIYFWSTQWREREIQTRQDTEKSKNFVFEIKSTSALASASTMDFESDPAADFLNREREELGDLENEIISNGELGREWNFCQILFFLSNLRLFPLYRSSNERWRVRAAVQWRIWDGKQRDSVGWTRWW